MSPESFTPFKVRRPLGRAILVVAVGAVTFGCGGYMAKTDGLRKALGSNSTVTALEEANEALGVDSAERLPQESDADTPLLLLERATILQALGRYKLSARDFQVADKQLDVLDLTGDTAGKLGKYLFSDSATVYKAPPYEKLLLNTMNMLNYLAQNNANGAMIEARRFLVNRRYLKRIEDKEAKSMLALGSFLAGVAFEAGGESEQAIRHFGDALDAGGVPGLAEAARALMQARNVTDSRLDELVAEAIAPQDSHGRLVIVIQAGMAPYKRPERIPIGAAIVASSNPNRRGHLSPAEQRRANVFAAKGVLKWVNYPKLVRGIDRDGRVWASVGQQRMNAGIALDVALATKLHYEAYKGGMIAAAVVRLISRAVAGEASQAAGKKLSNSGIAGLLIGLAVEGAMTAADVPDTRSWVTLPGRYWLAYGDLPAGEHFVRVGVAGQVITRRITVTAGQTAVMNISDIR